MTSTNDEAIVLIKKNRKEIGCVYAKKQTKGKGTHGKRWVSNEGNLFSSIFFKLKKNYPSFSEFSIINPVIISSVIKKLCMNEKISVKWPNDIFLNGKKVCGILQEIITKNNKKFLIIGIGVNIISNPALRKKYQATNIFLETKRKITAKKVLDLIILSYENFFIDLKSYNYLEFKKKINLMSLN